MRRRVRHPFVFVSGACALVLCVVPFCLAGADVQSAAGADSVRIGLEAPLTGDQKSIGIGMLDGARLAAKLLNARGGILGKTVEIVPIDDAADPATGVNAAKSAITNGLDAVVGPYNSGVGAQTLPLYIAAGLVPIRLTSADSTNGMGFTLQPMTYQIAPVAAQALTTWLKAQSVAIVYDSTALYTQTVSAALKTQLDTAGVKITAFQPIQPAQTSYIDVIKSVAAANPDVIYVAAYYPEAGLIAKEMLQLGVAPKCVADYGAYALGYIKTAGPKAAQNCPVVGVPAPNEFSGATKHVAAYRNAFKRQPGSWSPYTYDSVNFLAQGVHQAGSFDPAKLTTALNNITNFTGWTGTVKIDPATGNREPATVVVLATTRQGTFAIDSAWAKAVHARI
jgi:branched-chain amino acid transport system substrate-binding protein